MLNEATNYIVNKYHISTRVNILQICIVFLTKNIKCKKKNKYY